MGSHAAKDAELFKAGIKSARSSAAERSILLKTKISLLSLVVNFPPNETKPLAT